MNPKKISTIMGWPAPKNISEVYFFWDSQTFIVDLLRGIPRSP